jgi:hypothetical protein
MTRLFAIALMLAASPAMAAPPCGQPEDSMSGPSTCPGYKKLSGEWENWDGCNGRAYDACGRHVWVHYRHWHAPPGYRKGRDSDPKDCSGPIMLLKSERCLSKYRNP